MEDNYIWITMSYSLPVEPSGCRVYVWRKLRELGAESLSQGVAVLPLNQETTGKLRELAARVRGMNGEAVVAELRFLEEQDHRRMVERFKKQSRKEYEELLEEALRICDKTEQGSGKALRKRYQSARTRDFFGAREDLAPSPPQERLLEGLDLDGGWAELMSDLRQGCRELGIFISQGGTQGK